MTNELRRMIATPNLKLTIRSQGRMDRWVGEQIGLSKGHFSKVLSGTRTVSVEQAELVGAVLGVPLFLLFEFADANYSMTERIAA